MFIEEVFVEEVKSEILKLLRSFGIRNLKKLHTKILADRKIEVYHVFKTPLELLEKESVNLPQSKVLIEIPVFILDTCRYIEQNVLIEGLFRKAGSTCKQRELRALLDCGNRLITSDDIDVINVANILKLFFRELPEPLVPYKYHDALIRSLFLKDNKIDVILLICLLFPSDHLNTLAYLMQFLHHVAKHSNVNKMDVGNLAIIFTPSVMPVNTAKLTPHGGERINHHVQVIKILIENSMLLGVVPELIHEKLGLDSKSGEEHGKLDHSFQRTNTKRAKRSSSLTRVLSGIKRIMNKTPTQPAEVKKSTSTPELFTHTPRIMSSKKRRAVHTPVSIKKKFPNNCTNEKTFQCTVELPICVNNTVNIQVNDDNTDENEPVINIASTTGISFLPHSPEEFVKIPKSEYETIKERVAQIESRIENEFINITEESIKTFQSCDTNRFLPKNECLNVEKAYINTRKKSEKFNDSCRDDFSQQYYKNLNLRRSLDNPVRSPSARRIGSIKRRSKDNGSNEIQCLSFNSFDTNKVYIQSSTSNCNLKRGRPNTVFSGLTPYLPNSELQSEKAKRHSDGSSLLSNIYAENNDECSNNEENHWRNAPDFFKTKECTNTLSSDRDSLIKIRSLNVGKVLEKAKAFEANINLSAANTSTQNSSSVIEMPKSLNFKTSLSPSFHMDLYSYEKSNKKLVKHMEQLNSPITSENTVLKLKEQSEVIARMPHIKQSFHTPSPKKLAEIRHNKIFKRATPIKLYSNSPIVK